MNNKKAVLTVSFGTSCPKTIENCIESTENDIRLALPDFEVRRAFTSGIILRKLKSKYNMLIDNPSSALRKLSDEGFAEIIVQPLFILPATEYGILSRQVNEFGKNHKGGNIALGEPLLFRESDYETVSDALIKHCPKIGRNEAVILMGHGTAHYSNACYFCLQHYLNKKSFGIFIANIEAPPRLSEIIPVLRSKNITKIYLMPFMLTAGEHVHGDMAGNGSDSWVNILKREGFDVEYSLKGLGEFSLFRNIYVQKAIDIVNSPKKPVH